MKMLLHVCEPLCYPIIFCFYTWWWLNWTRRNVCLGTMNIHHSWHWKQNLNVRNHNWKIYKTIILNGNEDGWQVPVKPPLILLVCNGDYWLVGWHTTLCLKSIFYVLPNISTCQKLMMLYSADTVVRCFVIYLSVVDTFEHSNK